MDLQTRMGCFGSALFKDRSPGGRCERCPLQVACEDHIVGIREKILAAAEGIASLRSRRGKRISNLINDRPLNQGIDLNKPGKVTEADAEEEEEPQLSTTQATVVTRGDLNKKPMEFYQKWVAQGVRFEDICKGINAFATTKATFARVAVGWLIEVGHMRITRSELSQYLVRTLGWSEGTAKSHTNILCDVLEYAGVIVMDGAHIHLKRTVT
jgi:hypothetical protein